MRLSEETKTYGSHCFDQFFVFSKACPNCIKPIGIMLAQATSLSLHRKIRLVAVYRLNTCEVVAVIIEDSDSSGNQVAFLSQLLANVSHPGGSKIGAGSFFHSYELSAGCKPLSWLDLSGKRGVAKAQVQTLNLRYISCSRGYTFGVLLN